MLRVREASSSTFLYVHVHHVFAKNRFQLGKLVLKNTYKKDIGVCIKYVTIVTCVVVKAKRRLNFQHLLTYNEFVLVFEIT